MFNMMSFVISLLRIDCLSTECAVVHIYLGKGAVSDFWEHCWKQTEQHNTLVANQKKEACPLMMQQEREWARGRFEKRL